ncbi:alpha/beta hydrolase domain-containing protein [Lipingzhangella sp. LS1_29]|uniref:Alpha/beta hydrolase domain-containing protein n=1 Tax=Lipingzhangella rawalii TaxID=2055835 RepID=A0ABU2H4T3_9ACTN|nr:alpha/beta hydrolase domain-containing protein [Lipingzhangella rawalii]MDS1270303.1 alpha/beta hydrolase domain-containing protein [Lipingzhangella rawalii]
MNQPSVRLSVIGAATVLLGGLAAPAAATDPDSNGDTDRGDGTASVPAPEVIGPLAGSPPGDPKSDDIEDTYPFFASTEDLDAHGYVEEEFLVRGSARQFEDQAVTTEHPYTTRIVVRRPAEARSANGTALVEWQNVTAGHDLDALWAPSAQHIMRSGYTWVGVSAQHVGVSHLTGWSPARYGDLDVTDGGTVPDDQLSYDIFAQAGQAIASDGADLLGDVEIDQLLAIGASQSAGRMVDYYEDVLPATEPVFDGYGYMVGAAPSEPTGPEPVFQVVTENDVLIGLDGDSPADSEHFRNWQVAGSGHSPWAGQDARSEVTERDLGSEEQYNCVSPPFSRIPLHQVINASLDHLDTWSGGGAAPPMAEPIERTEDGAIARDADGMALGGIRTSALTVPTAVNTGVNAPADDDSAFCVLFGSYEPFDAAELDERYRNHGHYMSEVAQAERELLRDGFVVPADSAENRREAARSDIGR